MHPILLLAGEPTAETSRFYLNLGQTLGAMSLQPTYVSDLKSAWNASKTTQFQLFLFSPDAKDLDPEPIRSIPSPKAILAVEEGFDTKEMVDRFDADGTIFKSYRPAEMAFVINRLVFPWTLSRRIYPRVMAPIDVEYSEKKLRKLQKARAFNVSLGGMYVETESPVLPGNTIDLSFHLPEKTIQCEANVVYSEQPRTLTSPLLVPGMGVEFLSLSPKDLVHLRDFVRKYYLPLDRKIEPMVEQKVCDLFLSKGSDAYKKKDFSKADTYFRRALTSAEHATDSSLHLSLALRWLALIAYDHDRLEESHEFLKEALRQYEQVPTKFSPLLKGILQLLSQVSIARGMDEEAGNWLTKIEELNEEEKK